jgi:hypothetical protein
MASPDIRDISRAAKVTAVIRETRSMKATRNVVFNVLLALTLTLIGAASMTHPSAAQTQSQAQAQATSPTTTGVMVILTVKAGVTREQVMTVMPTEIRQTVQLYLNGKIREWYSRGDGRGVVLLLDTRDVAEAHAIMEGLPLAKQDLMDHEYIAVGPLLPLRLLMTNPSATP